MNRRNFLSLTGTFTGGSLLLPDFLFALGSQQNLVVGEQCLVFVQLNGGNDGLNTFIPFEDPLYYNLRPNIAISNTDDHLRNHGFILTQVGWQLSPAFDINPSIDKDGLSLTIDGNDNSLDFDLAKSVGVYFQLDELEMKKILNEVKSAVKNWKAEAIKIKISKTEIDLMASAFRF